MRIVIFILGISLLISGCEENKQVYYKVSGFAQGTTYNITYEGKQDFSFEINSLLKAFDKSLSTYKENSIISRVNQNDSEVKTDSLFKKVFDVSYIIWEETEGAFDITLAPVINAWGFGFTKASQINEKLIDSLLNNTGMNRIKLSGDNVIKQDSMIMLDGNAIAQGYSVDYISYFLENANISNYLVEIGGELKAKGVNPKSQIWKVGIDKPIEDSLAINRELKAILEIENKSLATSGNYRKFYKRDGIKYSHTIDPQTGYPVNHSLLSVTVITDDCIYADAYATAFMVMGFEKTIEFAKKRPDISIYLISDAGYGNYTTYYSESLKEYLVEELE